MPAFVAVAQGSPRQLLQQHEHLRVGQAEHAWSMDASGADGAALVYLHPGRCGIALVAAPLSHRDPAACPRRLADMHAESAALACAETGAMQTPCSRSPGVLWDEQFLSS